ncbi:MAG: adenylate/guanylate cyclase domain-containing protein [Gammaproteobacteria bacterium]|nr:MAG: adenylate/guanylate cyclase domain-containing protein [Gammaproteobacteria bacterium]
MKQKILHQYFLYPAAILLWLLGVWAFFNWGVMQHLEHKVLDWHLRGLAQVEPPDPDIVIIDINEYSLEKMAPAYGRFPWSRATHARLIKSLLKQKPKAIIFDLLIVEPHKDNPDDDWYFVNTVKKSPNVYLAMLHLEPDNKEKKRGFLLKNLENIEKIRDDANDMASAPLLLPLPVIRKTGRMGLINAEPDSDGIIRRSPLYMDMEGWRIPSLPLKVAGDLGYKLPTVQKLRLLWHGPRFSYTYYSYYDIYHDIGRNKRPRDEFQNKIIIVGSTATGLGDVHASPMNAEFPGVEVLATTIDNLKNNDAISSLPGYSVPALLAALLLSILIAFQRLWGPIKLGILLLATTTLIVLLSRWIVLQYFTHLPVVSVLIVTWLFYFLGTARGFILEKSRRQHVTSQFGRFLDPRVVQQLANETAPAINEQGQKQDITVLFSDIRGFTSLSEQKSAQEIVQLLNDYFSLQVETIFRHQGTLDKYMGDAIMAFWGAPTPQSDHVYRALCAARDMEQNLLNFRKTLGDTVANFDIGIGIHSGAAIVGFIGAAAYRQDYTVIGDTVNIASRIEGATRDVCRVLVSQAVYEACKNRLKFKDRGEFALKGKAKKIRLYEPIWTTENRF